MSAEQQDWNDLTEGELRARLEQRGCDPVDALYLARNQHMLPAAQAINGWLS